MSFAKIGSELFVNTTTAGEQYGSSVTQLVNGDIAVAWTDVNGSAVNVRGQILNADGVTKDGSEFMLNTTLTGDQFDVSLTALGNGGFAAGWTSSADLPSGADEPWEMSGDGAQTHVVTQVFSSSGTKTGGEDTHFLESDDYPADFNPTDVYGGLVRLDYHMQSTPTLTSDISNNGDDFDVLFVESVSLVKHYLAPIAFPTFVNYDMASVNIADFSGSDPSYLAPSVQNATWDYEISLSPLFPSYPANFEIPDTFTGPKSITLGDGSVATAYERYIRSSASHFEALVDMPGLPNPVRVGSDTARAPDIAELENGNVIVVWVDSFGSYLATNDDIRGQVLAADGTKIGGEFAVSSLANAQNDPQVAALADGRFVVVWVDSSGAGGDASGSSIKAQIFTAAGVKSGPEFLVNTVTGDDQHSPSVTALADGNFIVTWTSADGATDDIKSQVFDPRVYAGDGSNETVYGGSDDDHLDGGAGADVLYGGDGDDVFETVTPDDLADDDVFDGGAGIDTLDLDEYVLSWGGPAVLLGDNGTVTSVEVINLHGPTAGTGSNLIDIAIPLANSAEDGLLTVNGAQGQDVIRGDRVSNASVRLHLNGGGGADHLYGGAGLDELDGGTGADRLYSGEGDDRFEAVTRDDLDDGDIFSGGGGVDRLVFDDLILSLPGPPVLIGDNGTITGVEIIELADGLNNIELAIPLANSSSTGNLTVYGGSGQDFIHGERIGNSDVSQFLNGNEGDDELFGGAGSDTLSGGEGGDRMEGGAGNDLYVVDSVNDTVTEGLSPVGATGDLVIALIDYTLGANLEHLALGEGYSHHGTGNSLGNDIVGNANDNTLSGLGSNDHLYGEHGNDELDGGTGADIMAGGENDDTYIVDNAGDIVTELADEGGADIINSSINIGLSAYVENLILTGTGNLAGVGNLRDNILAGNAGNNALTGVTGVDYLYGLGGIDVLWGGAGGDTIDGGEGVDTAIYTGSLAGVTVDLTAGAGSGGDAQGDTLVKIEHVLGSGLIDTLIGDANANILNGASGADTMQGMRGDDTYIVDNAADVILEIANEGADTLNASVSYVLAAGKSVETMRTINAAATTAINLTGNELGNTIIGNAGNNFLVGGTNADTLQGLASNDSYIVDNLMDVVVETAGQGVDNVNASVSYVLGANVDAETLRTIDATATTVISLVGNGIANILTGNAGGNGLSGAGDNDTLEGLEGNDALTGGTGNDTFVFNRALNAATNVDQIVDFSVADDTIRLDDAIFTGLAVGTLAATAFRIGSAAADADDRIIYNSTTGALSFDSDGTGANAAIQFATLATGLAPNNNDFVVV